MNQERIEEVAEMLVGLKKYEWLKIAHAVEQKFSSMEGELELPSKEEIMKSLKYNW